VSGTESSSPSGFRFVGEREIHRGHVIQVVEGEFVSPDGETMYRDVVRHPGAVSVVPVDGDDIVLVRQYRAPAHRELLEIPAGKRDVPDEPPEVTAIRELEEEVGFTTDAVVPLARFFNSVGFSDEYSHVFLATDLRPVPLDPQGPEEAHMTIERVPVDQAAAWVADGRIEDAKTVVGVLAALRHLGR
jgi:8-oxo-dGTP pyrophosphatase MutT (NUDIX family)